MYSDPWPPTMESVGGNMSYNVVELNASLAAAAAGAAGDAAAAAATQAAPLAEDPLAVDAWEAERIWKQVQITRFVVWRILVPATVGFGVIGNMSSIAVLTRRSMRTSTNVYLTALAICDVLYLVFAFSMGLKHYPTVLDSLSYRRFRKPFGMALVDTFSNTGVWLTLTFTIERYIGVCHPMKGKVLCTPQRARYIVVTVCLCTFILTFPEFFSFRSVTRVRGNKTVVEYEEVLEANTSYQWGFKYLHQVLFTLGPLVSLLIFNSLLIRAVLTAAKQRRSMAKVAVVQNDKQDRHHREQQKITVMLIMVVIVFLLCQLPQAVTNLYYTYLDVTQQLNKVISYRIILTANVCNLLVMINSSANFILYSAFSLKFRRTFKQIFCKCLVRRKKPPDQLMSDIYSNDGSKTNLILRAQQFNSGTFPRHSPRHSRCTDITMTTANATSSSSSSTSATGGSGATVAAAANASAGSKVRTKNGYLAVTPANKSVSSV